MLLGNSTAGRARTARLTHDLRDGAGTVDGVGLLVAADQEGGLVQRLQGPGSTRIPSARTQAGWSDRTLRRRATTWSTQLGHAGIDLGLAPVADVVPSSVGRSNEAIGAAPWVRAAPRRGRPEDHPVVEGMHAAARPAP